MHDNRDSDEEAEDDDLQHKSSQDDERASRSCGSMSASHESSTYIEMVSDRKSEEVGLGAMTYRQVER